MSATTTLPRPLSRPRWKRSVELHFGSDGAVYVMHPAASDFVIHDLSDEQRALLRALDGRPVDELPPVPAGATVVVEQLAGAGLLEDLDDPGLAGLPTALRERYDRQLQYFGDVLPAGGVAGSADAMRRLLDARVVVLGLGGLGSWTALALACTGIGCIVGVDGDVVEASNFNRQVLFGEADLGRPKVEVVGEALARFNSALEFVGVGRRLEGPEAIRDVVRGADFVVAAADWPPHAIGSWVNAACFAEGIPHVSASQFPPFVRVGPTYVPGQTGCVACQHAAYRREHPLFDAVMASSSEHPMSAATFGPACAVIGGVLANDAVLHLAGLGTPALLGRAVTTDLRTLARTEEAVPREPGCAICG